MHFDLNETQAMVRANARRFAERVLMPRASTTDRLAVLPPDTVSALAEAGFLGINVPAEYGGAAAGAVAYSLALTEISAACASTAVLMAVTNMVAELIARFGNEAQRTRYVTALCSGERGPGAFALSEAGAGSDPSSMTTTATPVDGGYLIDGAKQWITNGDRACVFVVWARTGGAGSKGLSCFLVDRDAHGLSVGRHEDKMGLRGSATVALSFDSCWVPETALLGALGQGFKLAMVALDGGRIGIASQSIGIARSALREAVEYGRAREQFGRPIAEFQAVRWMLSDSHADLEAATLLTFRAAWLKEIGQKFSQEAAMAKVYASEAAWRVCNRALQIHGGYGYTREFAVERHLRDVRVAQIYEGTSEIQRLVIARSLLGADR